ncbi:GNAT family N-acetyltransferase [Tenacibaculum caenipelagi]|uniref:RimJ/RimL family protein N-acetyltransferase n=1 Tax=Tenacibaculum caenipelagi TaxID=1325435 RepID=A0A4R6TGE5_9FLAO|nr:GNAT family protein [Tenacibaculum caenipelagi]TDQ25718.1 RimJ/RimL family protein N-acetyltransferase [Tenacibaculum caenipelagi]
MKNFPKIETERLFLTELKAKDISDIVKYASNKNISDFTQNIPFPYSEKDAIFWINMANQGFENGNQYTFAIRLKEKDNFIGGIGIKIERKNNRAEIGYWIAEPFSGNGYATEATKAILKFGFDNLNLNKFTSSHLANNPASGQVLKNSGMKKEGELKEHIFKNSKYIDLILFGLTKKQNVK